MFGPNSTPISSEIPPVLLNEISSSQPVFLTSLSKLNFNYIENALFFFAVGGLFDLVVSYFHYSLTQVILHDNNIWSVTRFNQGKNNLQ